MRRGWPWWDEWLLIWNQQTMNGLKRKMFPYGHIYIYRERETSRMAHKLNLLVGLMRNHFQTYRKIPVLSHLWVLEEGGFHEVLRWDFPSISGDIFRVVSNGCEGPNLAFLVVLLCVWNVFPKWKTTLLKNLPLSLWKHTFWVDDFPFLAHFRGVYAKVVPR